MSNESMRPENEMASSKKPEFIRKQRPEDNNMSKIGEERKEMILAGGFSLEVGEELIKVCSKVMSEEFPPSRSGQFDGSATMFTTKAVEKVSDNEAVVTGTAERGSGMSMGTWKFEVKKDGSGSWNVEQAIEQ